MKATAEKATKEAFATVQKAGMKVIDAEPDQRVVYGESSAPREETKKEEKPKAKPAEKPAEKAAEKPAEKPKEGEKEEDAWSQEQQKQLELALREFPATMEAQERWTKIAEKVTGKTKKQCIDRFKMLRDAIKKTAPPAKK